VSSILSTEHRWASTVRFATEGEKSTRPTVIRLLLVADVELHPFNPLWPDRRDLGGTRENPLGGKRVMAIQGYTPEQIVTMLWPNWSQHHQRKNHSPSL